MEKVGKIAIQNLKTLITGSSTRFADTLVKYLINRGSTVYTVDRKLPKEPLYGKNHHFEQGDLADETFFNDYLKKIEPIDALVNFAGFKSSYNYFLSYLISKNILQKFQQNEINKFGCRGCIINLVYTQKKFQDEYFRKQDDFVQKYNISLDTIDDEVYRLADLLTAARIRCNTLITDFNFEENILHSLVTHIIEDQYVAGQVINLDDNLVHKVTNEEFKKEILSGIRYKNSKSNDKKYIPPPEMEINKKEKEISAKPITLLSDSSIKS